MSTIYQALEAIRNKNGGMLKPDDVVKTAENPKHALHEYFEWNDSAAGHKYRLWQARELIRVSVTIIGDADDEPIKAYWSFKEDRYNQSGGGYMAMVDVLTDTDRYDRMLSEAKQELDTFRKKYRALKELACVIKEIEKVIGNK